MRALRYIMLLLTMAVGANLTAYSQSADVDTAVMEGEITRLFDRMQMSGLGIAVTKGDSIIYQKSFGYKTPPAEGRSGVALENDDIFKIASVSKTFVATVIMRLVEEKRLKLSDDAGKYLKFPLRNPAFPDKKITVLQLLDHTSGINDNHSWWSLDLINPEVDSVYYKCYSPTAPGEQYKYCNMNYTLLGAVIEGVTGQRFDSQIDEIIMRPLGLEGGFNAYNLDRNKFVTLPYRDENTGEIKDDNDVYKVYSHLQDRYELGKSIGLMYPASGMKITTGSLAKYMMMHSNFGTLDGVKVISKSSEKKMQKNYVGKYNYGLSYRQYRDLVPGKVLHGQTGGGHGVKTCMIFEPKDDFGFVIFAAGSNTKYIDGYGDIHKPLIQILYKYLIEER